MALPLTETNVSTTETDAQLDYAMCAVSWPAIIAGGAAAISISLLLTLLGAGLGLSFVSPWTGAGMSGTAFSINAAIWLIIVQWLSAGMGGYMSGRLRNRWSRLHTDEVFFRDTAHGFLAWAIATVFTVAFLASAVGAVVTGGAHVAAGGAAAGVAMSGPMQPGKGPMAGPMAGPDNGPFAYYMDTLYRGDKTQPGTTPDVRGETARILVTGLKDQSISDADKEYLASNIESRTGVSHDEAVKRVDDAVAGIKDAEQKAKEAADAARKAAASFAFFTFFSMLIGAFIATVAGAIGGRQRDEV